MQKIMPCLWFDDQAEEAVHFYTSIFNNSRIGRIARYGQAGSEAAGRPEGTVMTIAFQLEGQDFLALNGGPAFTFSPAISLVVNCTTQEEIDRLWEKLSDGGEIQGCGWVKDKCGVSWQIVPPLLGEMLQDQDAEKAESVMRAMLQMDKIEIKRLEQADAPRRRATANVHGLGVRHPRGIAPAGRRSKSSNSDSQTRLKAELRTGELRHVSRA